VRGPPFLNSTCLSCGKVWTVLHLTEDKYQSLVSVANIECATVERFYERLFHKNAEPFLLEFLIVRIGFIANCESDGQFFGVVGCRTSSEPDSAPPVAPSAAFAAFRRAAAFFVTVSISITSFNLSLSLMLQVRTSRPRWRKAPGDGFRAIDEKMGPRHLIDEVTSE
jgi:hypothetical protein